MRDPFRIDGPAVVSFSGGRTSALMLRRILDAHGGRLPFDVLAVFANTGKERPETLDFVEECSQRWGVRIHWIERAAGSHKGLPHVQRFHEVDHATASRSGEPFGALIEERKFLPNPVTRFCTSELKIRPMRDFMRSLGCEHWTNIVGLRADEMGRVRNARAPNAERWTVETPLADAGITERDVLAFWGGARFDLRLTSWEGNCDLCFLKGMAKRQRIMRDRPDLADWWINAEARVGGRFRNHEPVYARLLAHTKAQRHLPMLLDDPQDEAGSLPCACTD